MNDILYIDIFGLTHIELHISFLYDHIKIIHKHVVSSYFRGSRRFDFIGCHQGRGGHLDALEIIA